MKLFLITFLFLTNNIIAQVTDDYVRSYQPPIELPPNHVIQNQSDSVAYVINGLRHDFYTRMHRFFLDSLSLFGYEGALLREFGDQRIRATPITEAALTGMSIGAAGCGFAHLFEQRIIEGVSSVRGIARATVGDVHQAVRVAHRQLAQHQRINQRKRRGAGSDGQRQRHHRPPLVAHRR